MSIAATQTAAARTPVHRWVHSCVFTLSGLVGLTAATIAPAAPITWGLTSGTNWGTPANWSPTTTVNTSGTFSLVYSGTGGASNTGTNSFNNVGTVKVDSINFANTSTVTGRSFRISGGGLSMSNGTITTAAVTTSTGLTDSIFSPLTLTGSNTVNLGTKHGLNLGAVTGGGSLFKTGAGQLALSSSFTLTEINVNAGSLSINSNAGMTSLGNTTVRVGSNSTSAGVIFGAAASGTTAAQFTLGGTASFQSASVNFVTFTNGTFNAANSSAGATTLLQLSRQGVGATTQTINGVIQDNGIGKKVNVSINAAAWVLNGANTYTGSTEVTSSGVALFNGSTSASSAVTSSGYLGGSGNLGGLVTIQSGTVSPGGTSTSGTVIDTTATLTVGSLSLGAPSVTIMGFSGTSAGNFDRIVTSGSFAYGGTLRLTDSGTAAYANNAAFNLFDAGTFSGDFNSLANVAGTGVYAGLAFHKMTQPEIDALNAIVSVDAPYTYQLGDWISDWRNTGVGPTGFQRLVFSQATGELTVVPEPTTIVFAGIGMAMFGWSSWTRRRAKARRQAIEAASR